MLEIFGVPFSVHTRKVLLTLREKHLPFELIPVIPLWPPAGWQELSPLGKIPVLRAPELTVADSSVICQYIERTHPETPLYPEKPAAFARALWLEEFVDGALAPHMLRGLLAERAFAQKFFNRAPDEALVRRSLEQELPPKLSYLEAQVSGEFLVEDRFSIADIAVASMLINFHFAGEHLRGYPKLDRYLQRLLRRPSFQQNFASELPGATELGTLDLTILREAMR